MDNVTEYLSQFNQNPVCSGVGVTEVPDKVGSELALAFYMIGAGYVLITSVMYLYMRNYRRRLKIRSMNPIVTSSIGSAIIIIIRGVYNYVGRENLLCSSSTSFMYIFCILNLVPDNMAVSQFLSKQKYRQEMMSRGVSVARKEHAADSMGGGDGKKLSRELSTRDSRGPTGVFDDSTVMAHRGGFASPIRYAKGFWNHWLTISESMQIQSGSKIVFHPARRFPEDPYISQLRELSYEMLVSPRDWFEECEED